MKRRILQARKAGKTLALEYEKKGSHTTEQLQEKKATALGNGMEVKFICSGADYPFIAGAVGEDFCIARGSAVTDYLADFGNRSEKTEQKLESATFTEQGGATEALEAFD